MTDDSPRPGLLLTVLSFASMVATMGQAFVIPLLPEMQRDLHTSITGVSWVLTGNLLAGTVATPILGRLGDMHGKRRYLIVALALCVAGSCLAAASTTLPLLLAGRVLQGSAAAVFPLALSIVRDEFPPERMRAGVGTLSALISVGGGLGFVGAGLLTEVSANYQGVFWVAAGAFLVALVGVLAFVPESPITTKVDIDVIGAGLLVVWLICLLLPITEGNTWGWTDTRTVGFFAAAAVLCALWLVLELRVEHPLVDMRTFTQPAVLLANAGALVLGFGMFVVFLDVGAFVEMPSAAGYGFSASVLGAAIFLLPYTIMSISGRPIGMALVRRIGLTRVLALSAVVFSLALIAVAFVHAEPWQIYLVAAVVGIGVGTASVVIPILLVEAVPQDQMGIASGINTIIRTVGGALGGAVSAALIAAAHPPGARFPSVDGFTDGFLAGASAWVLLLILILLERKRSVRSTELQARAS